MGEFYLSLQHFVLGCSRTTAWCRSLIDPTSSLHYRFTGTYETEENKAGTWMNSPRIPTLFSRRNKMRKFWKSFVRPAATGKRESVNI